MYLIMNDKKWTVYILFYMRFYYSINGGNFTLSPLGDAYVCSGEILKLTCVTGEQFLEWNIIIPSRTDYVRTRLISSSETRDIPPLIMNYTIFSFHRESRVPLNITLTITNATVDMKIFCIEHQHHDSGSSTSLTRVNVVSSESDVSLYLSRLDFVIADLSLEENNVTVGIFRKDLPYPYHNNISFMVTPHATVNATNATMTLSYNVLYDLTVLGTLCRYTSSVSISYANCGPPILLANGYINPYTSTRDGAEVNVTCPSESQQRENYTVLMTCDQIGSWQPNPTFTDICNEGSENVSSNIVAISVSVVISVIIVVLIIISIFIVGCILWRKWRMSPRLYRQSSTGEDTIQLPVHTVA